MNDLVLYEPRIFRLYVHENKINKKKYFGITKNQAFERWERYGSGYKRGTHIRNAFLKYGWDSFNHFVVIDNLTYSEALTYEKAFIALYKTTDRAYGYNKDKGGKDFMIRAEVRKKLEEREYIKPVVHMETGIVYSDSNIASYYTGYKASSIRRTCNSKKFLLFNSHWAYKCDYDKLTNEEIDKILKTTPKNYMDDNRKVVCLESGEVFDNAKCAQKVYTSTTAECIKACCKKYDPNRITAAKKHWLYLSDYNKLTKEEIEAELKTKQGQKVSKAVIKLETKEVFSSIEEASSKTGLSSKTIRYSCTGQWITTPKNGHWMFKSDYNKATPKEIEERLKISMKGKMHNMRKVKCIETGEVFKSITEANEAVGGCKNSSMISKCCKNPHLSYKGYHWEYVS